jgi:dinuclear metal center YbgI/SA1388 family protein
MNVQEVIQLVEDFAPLSLQEKYDNAGLAVGDKETQVTGVLCTVDVTEAVIDEAIRLKVNLIISHHPVIFAGIKSLTAATYTERIIIKAIKNNIALYAAHTNADNLAEGVNHKIAKKLGLTKLSILEPLKDELLKLVTFVPHVHADKVRQALFDGGAGHIGNYDSCSYNTSGQGTFRGGEDTNPFVGEKGTVHFEDEIRLETIVPKHLLKNVLQLLFENHPYEEVAYDLYPLANENPAAGAGMTGELIKALSQDEFLNHLKAIFGIPVIRYAGNTRAEIKKVAVCGGSGSFLIQQAIRSKADAFITADLKYHQFFDAADKLLLCDVGHYESEQFTKELFYSLLIKKLSKFAVHLSKVVTNPVKYHV